MELLNNEQLKQLQQLRKWLHQNPELSGKELQTSSKIEGFIQQTAPTKLIKGIGGTGIAAIYHFTDDGPTVLVRADMDALPIDEINTFSHKSQTPGVSHKCGHDGHSTILAGLALVLQNKPLKAGRVVLLFQPEEETGQGAAKVIADEAFKMILPDYTIALHNLPGFDMGTVIIKEGPFAAASTGMIINIKGTSSHAAHPEQGNSPATMMAKTILQLQEIPQKQSDKFTDFALITLIHARLGEVAFGTNPGNAQLMATLRTFFNDDMDILKKEAEKICKILAEDYQMIIDISYTEEFPATINHSDLVELLKEVCEQIGTEVEQIKQPFRWSEDFGHFTSHYKGMLFGLGSGKDSPGLHNPDYDFPDEIIPSGVEIFYQTLEKILSKS